MALSLVLEVPLAIALGWKHTDRRRLALTALGVTLLTHPFAWTLNVDLAHVDMVPRLLFIEFSVVFIEGLIYGHWAKLGWIRGFAISAACNAFSFGVGLLMF